MYSIAYHLNIILFVFLVNAMKYKIELSKPFTLVTTMSSIKSLKSNLPPTFIKSTSFVNNYESKITMSMQKDPYFCQEWRICYTEDTLLLSGSHCGSYFVFEFPLKKPSANFEECQCEENEVEIQGQTLKLKEQITLSTTCYNYYMDNSFIRINTKMMPLKIKIPYVIGEFILRKTKGEYQGNGIKYV